MVIQWGLMRFNGILCGLMGSNGIYPLVNITIWKITMFNGKIHHLDWAIFNSELLNYQRVILWINGRTP